jgi:anti-anti-sigma factor
VSSIAYSKSRLVILDVTLESSFDPVSIVTTGPTSAALIGELDLAGISAVRAALAGFDGDIKLDCSGLAFIDAAGLRTLIDVRTTCEKKGTRLVLVNPSRCLVRLLELANLSAQFNLSSPE